MIAAWVKALTIIVIKALESNHPKLNFAIIAGSICSGSPLGRPPTRLD